MGQHALANGHVWCVGSIIIFRLRRFHICASYVGTFLLLSWIRSEVTGNPWLSAVAPLTGPMYQLFVFFMITDPRSTVRGWRSQCLVASLVAVAEMVLRLNGVIDAPYYALFLVGPVANFVDLAIGSQSAPPSAGDIHGLPNAVHYRGD
jgi:Na+-translocating ferredoxin:NAD+ oxidoreductase RnfD subunit